jgi:hypothetical protein
MGKPPFSGVRGQFYEHLLNICCRSSLPAHRVSGPCFPPMPRSSFSSPSFRSHIGKAILSQPACVSKLLSLLLDQRPSPKLVLIILQLCRAALPLMSVEDCGNVELPPWSYSVPSLNSEQEDPSDPASKIASLLLAKLADYVVPGEVCLPVHQDSLGVKSCLWPGPRCACVFCDGERWEREGSLTNSSAVFLNGPWCLL